MVSSLGRTYSADKTRWRVGLLGVWLASLLILFTPASSVPSGLPISDKVIHVCLFAGLGITAHRSVARVGSRGLVLLTVATYAVLSEIAQSVLPLHRDFSWGDIAADLIGVALGLLGSVLLRARSSSRRDA